MICPRCSSHNLNRIGKTSANSQRWKCRDCGKTLSEKKATIKISDRVLDKIKELPQVQASEKDGGWSESFLIEQVLRNYLGLEADYNNQDLAIILGKNTLDKK